MIVTADEVKKLLTPFNYGYRLELFGQVSYLTDDSKSPVSKAQAEAILAKLAAKIPLDWLTVPIYLLPYTLRHWDGTWYGSYAAEAYPTHIIVGAGCDEATFVHELGHSFGYRFIDDNFMDSSDTEKFAEYKVLRGIADHKDSDGYYVRPGELLAEDFRYLLGFGKWESKDFPPPEPVILTWIKSFLKGEVNMPKEVFTDIKGHWAKDNIVKVKELGLMDGYPDGTFKPDKPITRAELATVLVKLLEKG